MVQGIGAGCPHVAHWPRPALKVPRDARVGAVVVGGRVEDLRAKAQRSVGVSVREEGGCRQQGCTGAPHVAEAISFVATLTAVVYNGLSPGRSGGPCYSNWLH